MPCAQIIHQTYNLIELIKYKNQNNSYQVNQKQIPETRQSKRSSSYTLIRNIN